MIMSALKSPKAARNTTGRFCIPNNASTLQENNNCTPNEKQQIRMLFFKGELICLFKQMQGDSEWHLNVQFYIALPFTSN